MNDYIRSVAEYVIQLHTIEETAAHFEKSISSIKKYLSKVRDVNDPEYDELLAKRLKLAQDKIILMGIKKGGSNGKRKRILDEESARLYAKAYMLGQTYRSLADLSMIPKSTLQENIRNIPDENLQNDLDKYKKIGK